MACKRSSVRTRLAPPYGALKMKKILLILSMLILPATAHAYEGSSLVISAEEAFDSLSSTGEATPEDTEDKLNYFGLGLTAGSTSGIGITNKFHSNYGLGYQLTGGIFGTPGDFIFASVGTQLTYTFGSIKNARIYGITGIGSFLNRTVEGEWDRCDWNEETQMEENCIHIPEVVSYGAIFNFGAGLGIELILWDTIGLSFDLPLSTSISIDSGMSGGYVNLLGFFPIPNASLVYYF